MPNNAPATCREGPTVGLENFLMEFTSIKLKTSLLLLFIALVTLVFSGPILVLLDRGADRSAHLRAMNRQCTLSQTMGKTILTAMARAEKKGTVKEPDAYRTARTLFERTLAALHKGGAYPIDPSLRNKRHIDALEGAGMRTTLDRIQKTFRHFTTSAENGLRQPHDTGLMRDLSDLADELHDLSRDLEVRYAEMNAADRGHIRWLAIFQGMVSILLLSFTALFLNKTLLTPLTELARTSQRLATGDLVNPPDTDRADEIGALSQGLNDLSKLLESLFAQLRTGAHLLNGLSKNLDTVASDLRKNAEGVDERVNQVTARMTAVGTDMAEISTASHDARANMTAIAAAAGQSSVNMMSIASSTAEANNSLNMVAANSEEAAMSLGHVREAAERTGSSVAEMSNSIDTVIQTLDNAREKCQTPSSGSNETTDAILANRGVLDRLVHSGQAIGKVLKVIKGIAEQTNMLALNASIEAAGAGEAGKGFAVVANEVKDLARQTSEAITTISENINDIQSHSQEVGQLVESLVQAIDQTGSGRDDALSGMVHQGYSRDEITRIMSRVTQENEEVARRIGEVADGIGEVTRNVGEIANGIESVTRNVGDASSGIESMAVSVSEAANANAAISDKANLAAEASQAVVKTMMGMKSAYSEINELGHSIDERARETADAANEVNGLLARYEQ